MRKISTIVFSTLLCVNMLAQNNGFADYIGKYKDIAQQEMQEYGIPASITLAQGILESAAGKSRLALEANNHFGIKCQKAWNGERIYHDDDAKGECFRSYSEAIDSYKDHSLFLVNRPRYAFLFDFATNDYKSWAFGLKQAGYATDPNYPTRLIKIIEDYNLNSFDSAEKITRKKVDASENEQAELVAKPKEKKKTPERKSFFARLFSSSETTVESAQNKVFSDEIYIADISAFRTHEVKKINGVKYVIAKEGDTYASIADELELYEKELLKANEVEYGTELKPNDIVFFSRKKNKSSSESYTFKEGDTMYGISQQNGIKVRKLYRLNGLIYGKEPEIGTVIMFKK